MASLETRRAVSRAGLKTRYLGPTHPDTIAARADMVTSQLADDIKRRLADAPPLTDAQKDRLAALIRGGGR